jgi:hypothetical protein
MPPATTPAGISPDTTLPAVITAPAPIRVPGSTVTRPASQTPSPISMGAASGATPSEPAAASSSASNSASNSASAMIEYGPMLTSSPSRTRARAEISVP